MASIDDQHERRPEHSRLILGADGYLDWRRKRCCGAGCPVREQWQLQHRDWLAGAKLEHLGKHQYRRWRKCTSCQLDWTRQCGRRIRRTECGQRQLQHPVGWEALYANTTGSNNTASGFDAPYHQTSGTYNVALTTGSNNIDIDNQGEAGDSDTIRIGTQGTQTVTVS